MKNVLSAVLESHDTKDPWMENEPGRERVKREMGRRMRMKRRWKS